MRKICCFAGHSKLYGVEEIYEKLIAVIENLVKTEGINEFWVGNYGAFDRLCAGAVRKLKEKYPQIRLALIIPYLTCEINENKDLYRRNYDDILIADIPQNTPQKIQIIKNNEYMANNSQILVCYVKHSFGGAAKTAEYARKRKIRVLNIADPVED